MSFARGLLLLMGLCGIQAHAVASAKPSPTASPADAEMLKDLDFYQSLDLIENLDQLEGEENGDEVQKK